MLDDDDNDDDNGGDGDGGDDDGSYDNRNCDDCVDDDSGVCNTGVVNKIKQTTSKKRSVFKLVFFQRKKSFFILWQMTPILISNIY